MLRIFFLGMIYLTFLTDLNASENDLFKQQINNQVTSLRINQKLSPNEKLESLAGFFAGKNPLFNMQSVENAAENCFQDLFNGVEGFKEEGDVIRPFIKDPKVNKCMKNSLSSIFKFKEKEPFFENIKQGEKDLTENWQPELKKEGTLADMILDISINKLVSKYSDSSGSYLDGAMLKNFLEKKKKSTSSDLDDCYKILAMGRKFFPLKVIFSAEDVINDTAKSEQKTHMLSVYMGDNEKNPEKIERTSKERIQTLSKEINSIKSIIDTMNRTGYPPKGAEEIFKEWNRTQGLSWISNKVIIAKFVLNNPNFNYENYPYDSRFRNYVVINK